MIKRIIILGFCLLVGIPLSSCEKTVNYSYISDDIKEVSFYQYNGTTASWNRQRVIDGESSSVISFLDDLKAITFAQYYLANNATNDFYITISFADGSSIKFDSIRVVKTDASGSTQVLLYNCDITIFKELYDNYQSVDNGY